MSFEPDLCSTRMKEKHSSDEKKEEFYNSLSLSQQTADRLDTSADWRVLPLSLVDRDTIFWLHTEYARPHLTKFYFAELGSRISFPLAEFLVS